jgi:plasmid stabilization system protein ParE
VHDFGDWSSSALVIRRSVCFLLESLPLSRIIREAENVAAFPRLGRIVPEFGNPQIREIISQSYRIIYKFDEEGDSVAILRIWHGARGTPEMADDP